jgi:hypothetical protein
MINWRLLRFTLLIFFLSSCYFINGGSNEFNYDFKTNEIIGSITRLEIETDSPVTYYTYQLRNNQNNTHRLNITNPDTSIYKLTVSQYSKDSIAYQNQSFILHPNAEYKITNHSNGDSKTFSIILRTDSLGGFIPPI